MDARQTSPSTARNREPILAVLQRVLPRVPRGPVKVTPPPTRVLEIASGTGEHAVFFARSMPFVEWQPSDPDAEARASIAAWTAAESLGNVAAPLALDMTADAWEEVAELQPFEAVVSINMIHISPWEATLGLMFCAGGVLASSRAERGILVTYGPYKRDGAHTAPSNEAFEEWLKARDPRFGVRDIGDVEKAAHAEGLTLREIVPMPANNFCLVFER